MNKYHIVQQRESATERAIGIVLCFCVGAIISLAFLARLWGFL